MGETKPFFAEIRGEGGLYYRRCGGGRESLGPSPGREYRSHDLSCSVYGSNEKERLEQRIMISLSSVSMVH